LAQLLSVDAKNKVLDAKNRLLVLVKTVNEETRFNSVLLEERLELINMNINLLTQSGLDSGTYSKRADSEENDRRSLFDARV